jgi:hypothetical protein
MLKLAQETIQDGHAKLFQRDETSAHLFIGQQALQAYKEIVEGAASVKELNLLPDDPDRLLKVVVVNPTDLKSEPGNAGQGATQVSGAKLVKDWLEEAPLMVPSDLMPEPTVCRVGVPIFRTAQDGFNLHIWFNRETQSRGLHTHPWAAETFALGGGYTESYALVGKQTGQLAQAFLKAGQGGTLPLELAHRVDQVEPCTVTAFAVGAPVNNDTWGVLNTETGRVEKEDASAFKAALVHLNFKDPAFKKQVLATHMSKLHDKYAR